MTFVIAFAVYWFTLAPAVWVGDSGELVAAAHTLGIPHPTGYPLWLLLMKGFTSVVPFGSVAWRANLFSALCAAGAAQVLAAALRRFGAGRVAAIGGGLSLAFLAPIWGEATVARTYSLAALFSASMLWCAARFVERPCGRWLVAHNALLGFGLANHAMVIAHVPALLALVTMQREGATGFLNPFKRPKLWAAALLAVVPGVCLYLYLPIRAAADPALEYRVPMEPGGEKPSTGTGATFELTELTLDHIPAIRAYLQRDFHHTHRWAQSAGDHATILGHHLLELGRMLTPLGVLFALVGVVSLWRSRRRGLVVAVVLLWLGNLVPLALHGAWWDVFLYSRYLTTGIVGVALLAGVGIGASARSAARRFAEPGEPAEPLTAGARVAVAVIAFALPALLLGLNWRVCDRRDAWLADDYGRALLAELPKDAQFLSGADSALYPLFELHFVEGERPDVTIRSPVQLPGDPELLLAWRAAKRGASVPENLPPSFTNEPAGKFEGLIGDRRGLLVRLRFPQWRDEPREAYELRKPASRKDSDPRPIRGLERDDEPDPFARSVIGAIEADLADAAAVRGDRAQARARLERVARLRCPRPWGAMTGIATLARLAILEKPAQPALAREDLELARTLARNALEDGDPRDVFVAEKLRQIENALASMPR